MSNFLEIMAPFCGWMAIICLVLIVVGSIAGKLCGKRQRDLW